MIQIRVARSADLDVLHALGRDVPELSVSNAGDFMSRDELLLAIEHPSSVFLVVHAEGAGLPQFQTTPPSTILGFAYARIDDLDRGPAVDQACFVYLAVASAYRRFGVGAMLCRVALRELRRRGVRHVYTWADPTSGVVEFMERRGFAKGKACVWMDRVLDENDGKNEERSDG